MGLSIQALGSLALAAGFERVARLSAMYPGMLVFYLLPGPVTSRLSESALFFIGFFSGAAVWAAVFWCGATAFSAMRHAVDPRRSTPIDRP